MVKIRHPRASVPLMSHTLTEPSPDPLPPLVREFGSCIYRYYVTDAIRDSGYTMGLAEAMEVGKAKFEADKAAGKELFLFSNEPPIRERPHDPVVYYMRLDRLVKIGTTTLIRARFDAIHPQGVMALEWGDRELERRRHNQFATVHSHGEWFHLEPELVDHIVALRESFRGENGETIDQWLEPRMPAFSRVDGRPSWANPPRRGRA